MSAPLTPLRDELRKKAYSAMKYYVGNNNIKFYHPQHIAEVMCMFVDQQTASQAERIKELEERIGKCHDSIKQQQTVISEYFFDVTDLKARLADKDARIAELESDLEIFQNGASASYENAKIHANENRGLLEKVEQVENDRRQDMKETFEFAIGLFGMKFTEYKEYYESFLSSRENKPLIDPDFERGMMEGH